MAIFADFFPPVIFRSMTFRREQSSFQKRDGVITCCMVTSNLLDRYALPMITINTCMKQKAILDNIAAYLANIAAILQLSRMAKHLPSVFFSVWEICSHSDCCLIFLPVRLQWLKNDLHYGAT